MTKLRQLLKNYRPIVVAAALIAVASSSAAAERGWVLRISGAWADPDFSFRQVGEEEEVRIDVDSEIGFAVDLEYRFSDRLGVDVGVTWVELGTTLTVGIPDVISVSFDDDLSFTPVTAALNIHLTPASTVDLYIAPLIAWVQYGDLEYVIEDVGRLGVTIDDDVAWGVALGLDVPIGERGWLVSAAASYLDTDLDGTDQDEGGRESFDFNTIGLRLGVGYRF